MLDVHRLRVFRSVVASGSVQAAAAHLGYTPSAVSQHVATLQRETGLVLVERVGRGLSVTDDGHALAAQTDAILARIAEAEAVVADRRARRTGTLSIAYFASVGAAWLPRVVRRLSAEFPDVCLGLELREVIPSDPRERPDLQLAVRQPRAPADPGFAAIPLLDDPYVVVMPDGHRLAGRAEIALPELTEEEWIDNDTEHGWCRAHLLDACRAIGFVPAFRIEARDYATAIALVAAGAGITVVPALGARHLPPGVVVAPVVRPRPVRVVEAVVRRSNDTPALRAAIDELRRAAAA